VFSEAVCAAVWSDFSAESGGARSVAERLAAGNFLENLRCRRLGKNPIDEMPDIPDCPGLRCWQRRPRDGRAPQAMKPAIPYPRRSTNPTQRRLQSQDGGRYWDRTSDFHRVKALHT